MDRTGRPGPDASSTGLAEEFEKEHPNVTIEVSSGAPSTEDLLQKLSAGFAGSNYPDISYAFGSWASELEASERTLDITEQVADPDVDVGRVLRGRPADGAADRREDHRLPRHRRQPLADLQQDGLRRRPGVDYPTEDWTWDDFRDRGQGAHRPGHQHLRLRLLGLRLRGDHLAVLAAPVAERRRDPRPRTETEATFDSDAGVEALTLPARHGGRRQERLPRPDRHQVRRSCSPSDRIGMITSGPWRSTTSRPPAPTTASSPLPGHRRRPPDGLRPGPLGALRPPGRQPRVLGVRVHQVADRRRSRTSAGTSRSATCRCARVRDRLAGVPEAGQGLPGLDVMAANSENANHARPTVPGYVGPLRGDRHRDLGGAAGAGRAGRGADARPPTKATAALADK